MKIQPQPRWSLIAHIDASTSDLEPNETREVDVMERAAKRDVDVTVQLRRTVTSKAAHLSSAAGHLATAALTGIASLAAAAAAAILLPLPFGLPLAAAGLGLGWKLAKPEMQTAGFEAMLGLEPKLHDEPDWEGTRTFRLGKDRTPGVIDAKPVDRQAATGTPTPRQLAAFVAAEMKRYPESRHAVMLSGHGMAYDNVIGMTLPEVAESLRHVRRETGKRPDLLILESCLMSNVEALAMLEGTARYAVVSEETMGADGLPWDRLLPAAKGAPEAFGRTIVGQSPEAGKVDTLALVDLDRAKAVSRAAERLAESLQPFLDSHKAEIREAFATAERLPRQGAPGVPAGSLVDLQGLADNLRARIPDPAVQKALDRVDGALAQAVLVHRAAEGYEETAGLSIQAPSKGFDAAYYAGITGMRQWAGLLHELQPWHRRLFHVAP